MNLSKDFLLHDTDFVLLDNFIDAEVILKLEGLNSAGSIKLKTAYGLIKSVKDAGFLKPDTVLIESSSGNLGCALAMVYAKEGYAFTCVVDPNAMPQNVKMMKALGATVHCVQDLDINGGYLGTRIDCIKKLVSEKPNYIWLNQ
jgi:cysteine synthase